MERDGSSHSLKHWWIRCICSLGLVVEIRAVINPIAILTVSNLEGYKKKSKNLGVDFSKEYFKRHSIQTTKSQYKDYYGRVILPWEHVRWLGNLAGSRVRIVTTDTKICKTHYYSNSTSIVELERSFDINDDGHRFTRSTRFDPSCANASSNANTAICPRMIGDQIGSNDRYYALSPLRVLPMTRPAPYRPYIMLLNALSHQENDAFASTVLAC